MELTDPLPRSHVLVRRDYLPQSQQEQFMVPLLLGRIEQCFDRYASGPPPGARALDVGCGRQPFRQRLESMGYAYTGADVQQNPEGSVDVTCAIDAPLPADLARRGPFQFILCTEVLEHVADWDRAFHNLAALAAPGCRLLLTAPHVYQLHEEPYDFWRPTLNALEFFARRVGLVVVSREAAGDAWDVVGTVLSNFRARPRGAGFFDRALAKAVTVARRGAYRLIKGRRIQRRVALEGPLYLSNVVVLEKPEAH